MENQWQNEFDIQLSLTFQTSTSDPLAELPNSKGILLFVHAEDKPLQLVQTARLRSFAKNRLSAHRQTSSAKPAMDKWISQVYAKPTATELEMHLTYQRLCHLVFGQQWTDWINLPEPVFAVLDRTKPFCAFAVSHSTNWKTTDFVIGLFSTRHSAERFCKNINELFCLCLNRQAIEQKRQASCPYGQIGVCDRPCLAENGQTAYAERIRQAVDYLYGSPQTAITYWTEQMNAASQRLDFETAQQFKIKVEKSRHLHAPEYQWLMPMDRWAVFHIDQNTSCKTTDHIDGWRLDSRNAYFLGSVASNDLAGIETLRQTTIHGGVNAFTYAQTTREHLATMHYLLFRQNRRGLWYRINETLPSASEIMADVAALFTKKTLTRSSRQGLKNVNPLVPYGKERIT